MPLQLLATLTTTHRGSCKGGSQTSDPPQRAAQVERMDGPQSLPGTHSAARAPAAVSNRTSALRVHVSACVQRAAYARRFVDLLPVSHRHPSHLLIVPIRPMQCVYQKQGYACSSTCTPCESFWALIQCTVQSLVTLQALEARQIEWWISRQRHPEFPLFPN